MARGDYLFFSARRRARRVDEESTHVQQRYGAETSGNIYNGDLEITAQICASLWKSIDIFSEKKRLDRRAPEPCSLAAETFIPFLKSSLNPSHNRQLQCLNMPDNKLRDIKLPWGPKHEFPFEGDGRTSFSLVPLQRDQAQQMITHAIHSPATAVPLSFD